MQVAHYTEVGLGILMKIAATVGAVAITGQATTDILDASTWPEILREAGSYGLVAIFMAIGFWFLRRVVTWIEKFFEKATDDHFAHAQHQRDIEKLVAERQTQAIADGVLAQAKMAEAMESIHHAMENQTEILHRIDRGGKE